MIEKKVSEDLEMHDMIDTYKTIIEALERHIPQKPKSSFPIDFCPKCMRVVYPQMTYCSHCGQALDWRKQK